VSSVLVTGAGRGIGRAAALRLARAGWEVLAGVRRDEDGRGLTEANGGPGTITPVKLDITDEAQLGALQDALPGSVDALVNNAGVVVAGPVELVPPAELRRQLEVNVVGQVAVTQALLPRLRAARGRLVFVSSVSGRVATPMFGPYSASKFALEAVSDALRMELAPWGVRVSLVEPAQTDTDLWRLADRDFDAGVGALPPEGRRLYAKHLDGFRKTIPRAQRSAAPVEGVAEVIERALTDRRPKARYVVGRSARLQATLASLTPTPVLDRLLGAGTGVPRRP
jgi:NAD(P)-dependent dehydrogenase (short-subunit alcohol dehydrogenase family)